MSSAWGASSATRRPLQPAPCLAWDMVKKTQVFRPGPPQYFWDLSEFWTVKFYPRLCRPRPQGPRGPDLPLWRAQPCPRGAGLAGTSSWSLVELKIQAVYDIFNKWRREAGIGGLRCTDTRDGTSYEHEQLLLPEECRASSCTRPLWWRPWKWQTAL